MWKIASSDHGLWLRVPNQVRDLSFSVQHIDGYEENARLHTSEIEIDQLDAIGEINCQPVALAQATLSEQMREPIAADVEFSKRPGLQLGVRVAPFESRCIRRPASDEWKRSSRFIEGGRRPTVEYLSASWTLSASLLLERVECQGRH